MSIDNESIYYIMKMNYEESLKSRLIYSSRVISFKIQKVLHKIIKRIKNIGEYLKADHITNHNKDKNINDKLDVVQINNDIINENNEIKDKRLAVYTCIFGSYDMICEPICKDKHCDYYIITDQNVPIKSIWKKIDPPHPKEFNDWNDTVRNRYYKMHPEIVFKDYDYSLYIDGNIVLLTDVFPFLKSLNNKFIGIFKHPQFNCFYQCAEFLKKIKLVNPIESDRQVKVYRENGFPENYGYFECCLLLRRHNDAKCIQLMNTWWEQYMTFVKRDQQSIMYSLWKNGLSQNDVACLGANIRRHPRFYFREHKHKHKLIVSCSR